MGQGDLEECEAHGGSGKQTVAVRKRVTKSIEEFFAIGVLVLNIYASRLIRNLI